MPVRAILIMFVVAVVVAVCYREPIYRWIKGTFSSKENKADEESEDKGDNE